MSSVNEVLTCQNNPDMADFAQKILTFARTCSTVNTHNLIELLALWAGKKRVVRIVASDATYDAVKRFCELTHLVFGHSAKKQAPRLNTSTGDTFTVSVPWDDPTGEYFAVIVGRREEAVTHALDCESSDVSFRTFGELYEYPECCIEGYSDIESGDDWIRAYLRRSPIDVAGHHYGNRLAVLFDTATLIPDFFPCCISCEPTRRLGEQYAQLLKEAGLESHLRQIRRSLLSPILIRHGALLQLSESQTSSQVIRYRASRDWQINWRGSLPANDPFYRANSLMIFDGALRFLSFGEVIAEEPVGILENRLLLFQ